MATVDTAERIALEKIQMGRSTTLEIQIQTKHMHNQTKNQTRIRLSANLDIVFRFFYFRNPVNQSSQNIQSCNDSERV